MTSLHATLTDFLEPTITSRPCFNHRIYVPLFLTFFLFISAINLIMSVTITGLIKHQERFFDMFLPPNLPLVLVPMMIALEVIGFFARAISLGVRLTANMLS